MTFSEWQFANGIMFQSHQDGHAYIHRFLTADQMESLSKVSDWHIVDVPPEQRTGVTMRRKLGSC